MSLDQQGVTGFGDTQKSLNYSVNTENFEVFFSWKDLLLITSNDLGECILPITTTVFCDYR